MLARSCVQHCVIIYYGYSFAVSKKKMLFANINAVLRGIKMSFHYVIFYWMTENELILSGKTGFMTQIFLL